MTIAPRVCALLLAACAACASPPSGRDLASTRVSHDVYFVLNDPGDAEGLVAACERLREIPGVVHMTVGLRDVTQTRDVNRTEYHVGLHVEFTGQDAYEAYGPHPVHQALLEEFGSKFAGVEVFDTLVGEN